MTSKTNTQKAPVENEKRTISVLGATGSVGQNMVDLLLRSPEKFEVDALSANKNAALLADTAKKVNAKFCVVADDAHYRDLKSALSGTGIEAASGADALIEAGKRPADWVLAAIVGAAGLEPTLNAVRRGAIVALANKECLVCAGDLFVREVEKHQSTLLPVDSEHNAIYQVFDFQHPNRIERIVLTASGGPFKDFTSDQMGSVTPEQAVRHPNWDMGAKISIDSATMMNKGLELIEAYHLFPVEEKQIDIVVHPQSVIHSMVEYIDGSVLAQMGTPDMRTPIAYTLAWPDRIEAPADKLRLEDIKTLTFETPDPDRFPALKLARDALIAGGSAPTVLNAANEVAVKYFLAGRIGFLDIAAIVADCLEKAQFIDINSLDVVFECDQETRQLAESLILKT